MTAGRRDAYTQILLGAVGSGIVAVGWVLGTVRDLVARGDYLPLFAVTAILLLLVRDLYRSLRQPRKPERLVTEVFSGLAPPEGDHIWSHLVRAHRVREAVLERTDRLVVVTGPSGTGKSVLLTHSLQQVLDQRIRKIDDYSADVLDGLKLEAEVGQLDDVVVVFDQIEAMLDASGGYYLSTRAERTIETLAALHQSGVRIIIAVRSERFVELRSLGLPLPNPNDALFIERITPDESGDENLQAWRAFSDRLEEVVTDEDVLRRLLSDLRSAGPITPLEMQLVGAIHEIRAKYPQEKAPDTVRPESAARWLLSREISSHDAPRTSMEILYVLAQFRLVRLETEATSLETLIDEPLEEVRNSLAELARAGIIRSRRNGRVLLAHDSLQPVVETLSATWMTPEERDTLRDLASRYIRDREGLLEVLRDTAPDRTRLPQIVIGLVGLIAIAGLIRALPWAEIQGSIMDVSVLEPLRGTGYADGVYLPIVFPHVAWCWYIFRHADRIYRFTDRTPRNRLTTRALLLSLLVAMTMGVVTPLFWVCAVALGGLMEALKSYEVSLSTPEVAVREWFRALAIKTFVNSSLAMVGGVVWGLVLLRGGVSTTAAQSWQYVISLLLFAAALTLRNDHVTTRRARLSRLLVRRAAVPA